MRQADPQKHLGSRDHDGSPGRDLQHFRTPSATRMLTRVLVGRSAELTRLDELADAACAGTGSRLLLAGDPGMGRTTLLGAARRRGTRRGLRVVRLTTSPGQRDIAGSLFDDLAMALGTAAPEVPCPTAVLAAKGLAMLRSLAAGGPTLLQVDDAHLLDDVSLEALRMAVERLGASALSTVLTVVPRPPLMRQFGTWPTMVLGLLEPDAAVAVLRAALGPDRGSPIEEQIVKGMHGNPLALTRAAESLSAEQLSGQSPLPEPIPLPNALAAGWARCLADLTSPTRDALVDLAVAGRADVLALMATPARDSTESPDSDLDEAVRAGLAVLDGDRRPVFRSPTCRAAVLDLASPEQVRDAHRRAAAASTELGIAAATTIAHLTRSTLGCDARVARMLAQQARRAEQEEHFEDAGRAWDAAARMTTNSRDRVGFALAAARLYLQVGIYVSDQLLDIISADYLDPVARATTAGWRSAERVDRDPEAVLPMVWTEVDRARTRAPQLLPLLLSEAAATAWELGRPQDGLRAAEEFAELAERGITDPDCPDPPWAGTAMLAAARFEVGDVERAVPLRREAISAARMIDPRTCELGMLLSIVSWDDVLLDDSPDATDRLSVALHRLGSTPGTNPCLFGIQAWRARARGDWRAARALVAEGRPCSERDGQIQPWLGMTALSVELASLCGDEQTLHDDARRLREVGGRCGDRRRLATLDRALGLDALVSGNLADAALWLADAADVPFLGRGLRDAVLPARVDLIEVLARTGNLPEAARRHGELHPLLVAMEDPLASALDERAAALVTGGEEAEAHYLACLAAHEVAGEPFERARSELLLGEHLRRQRRRSDSLQPLARAVHTFDILGARPWAQRARQELRAAGGSRATGRRAPAEAIAALTAQERAVASAVASGMSNREAAEALFLSPRTVEYHLGNAFRKLGVHGRGALARAMDPDSTRARSR